MVLSICLPEPGRPAACRGRLPGRLPRAGPEGSLHPRPRPAGQLALRGRAAGRLARRSTGSAGREDGRRATRWTVWARNSLVGATVPPADQPAMDREQAEVLHDEIDRLPKPFRTAVVLCYFEGLDPRRGGATVAMARRHLPQPAGPSARKAPARPDSPRRGPVCDGTVGGLELAIGLGGDHTAPVQHHDQSRDELHGRRGRSWNRLGVGLRASSRRCFEPCCSPG